MTQSTLALTLVVYLSLTRVNRHSKGGSAIIESLNDKYALEGHKSTKEINETISSIIRVETNTITDEDLNTIQNKILMKKKYCLKTTIIKCGNPGKGM